MHSAYYSINNKTKQNKKEQKHSNKVDFFRQEHNHKDNLQAIKERKMEK